MRDPSPYAGQTVHLRTDAIEVGGQDAAIADWYELTGAKHTWRAGLALNEPRAVSYNVRRGLAGLPDDDDVLLARVDGMNRIIHVSEIAGDNTPAPPPDPPTGPSTVSPSEVGQNCPACLLELAEGDKVAVLLLGPGANQAARANARAGYPFESVAVELHWACRTGDESYEQAGA